MKINDAQTKERDDKHNERRQAYTLPTEVNELRLKRIKSVHSSGYPEYASALISAWYAHRHIEPFAHMVFSYRIGHLYNSLSRDNKLITTTFYDFFPMDPKNNTAVQLTPEGITLSGRQRFASDVVDADELLVFVREQDELTPSTVVLVPADHPNLGLPLKTQAYAGATVTFDDLFVPKERVLVLQNPSEAAPLLGHPALKSVADYQWVTRQANLVELVTAVAIDVAERGGRHKELHIQGLLGELLQNLDTLKAFIHAAEIQAYPSPAGILLPAALPLEAAKKAGGAFYKQAVDGVLRIGTNHIDIGASEDDPLRQLVRSFASSEEAVNRSQHEQFAFGDPIRLSTELFRLFPQEQLRNRYEAFWRERGV
ncbi:4-hydroxyphenylacetate 3-hydroxylase C-terminal domain-containing protein [Paenibacillus naphthalenovorans]|uniref:4-hydroxyphenylacetate 3-hydroxylase C-terminal domain-containing protein n=1 Tax=Paenibacillus naphthalenovorans TaxID=162209 RepID=UPI0008916CFB|nr:4-hydroxyphenylacetate 3-hydroxylase C-terminal domain-containing protein [Paenibacillus naphthalenovorans]SDI54520.1 4-hydroxyphenylacetate 3-monooxygenase [Paenibacillus naphthalenovorans]